MLKKQKAAREEGLGATTQGCWVSFFAAPRREGWGCPGTPALTATTSEPHEETYALAWHRGSAAAHLWEHWTRSSGETPASLPIWLGHVSMCSQGWGRPLKLSSSTPYQKRQLPCGHVRDAVLWKVLVTRSCKLDVCEFLISPGTYRENGTPFTCQLSFLREQHSTPMD